MSRTIHWNDNYCPNGHKWVFCSVSTLFPDYYYCPEEDRFWQPTVEEITSSDIAGRFNADRPKAMRNYAKRNAAIEKIKTMPFEKVIAFAAPKEQQEEEGNE